MNRWYDKYEKLGDQIDRLKFTKRSHRDQLVQGVMKIIKKDTPSLLDRFVMDFPLDILRRRWYDKDPYLWLIINGLKYADKDLLDKVTEFLEEENMTL